MLALAIRLAYALAIAPDQIQPGDPKLYRDIANELAHGRGYQLARTVEGSYPTASHPPLYPLFLAAFTKVGLATFAVHRAVSCLLGTAAVVLVGLVGRRVSGASVGLVAASLAALYPQLFMVDGTVIAESLYAPLVALALLMSYRLLDRPDLVNAGALGAVVGLATLTRSDGLLLLLLLAVPVAWRAGRARWRLLAVVAASTALVLSPWLIRNWIRFDRFPLLATNGGLTQGATNCRQTFYDKTYIGFVFHPCALRSPCLRGRAEVAQAECFGREARSFLGDNIGRVPLVVAARVAREWNLYAPRMDLSYGQLWARDRTLAKIGIVMYALLVVFGVGGAVLLFRRGEPLLPLLSTFAVAAATATLAFGFSRYRLVAEPALVLLAAVGVNALISSGARLRVLGDELRGDAWRISGKPPNAPTGR
jgi:4-amino-4-deoxy-L-arabinose transferase-like glycosyltransferase